jgi:hypothetical protein
VDDKLGREDFGAAVDAWIDRHAVTDSTKDGYRVTARAWVKNTFQGRTIAQVAADRAGIAGWPHEGSAEAPQARGIPRRARS